MIRKLLAGIALTAVMIPALGWAENEMIASEGGFELWASTVGDEKGWAVVDVEDETTVVAEKRDGEVSIYTGKKAEASLATMQEAMPQDKEHDIVLPEGGEKRRMVVIKEISAEGEAGADGETRIEIKRVHPAPEAPEAPAAVDGTDAPEMTWTPEHPEGVTVIESTDGRTVVSSTRTKVVVDRSEDGDGTERTFLHMTGVDAGEVREFIDDIEDLTASEKEKFYAALDL